MGERFTVMAGTAGAARIKDPSLQEAKKGFPLFFQRKEDALKAEEERLFNTDPESLPGVLFTKRLKNISVFVGLWELHEELGAGLTAELAAIPLDQLIIEIFEKADLSPYEEPCGNAFIVVTDRPFEVLSFLKEKDIRCAVLGTLTENNDCVVISEAGKRYLTPERKKQQ